MIITIIIIIIIITIINYTHSLTRHVLSTNNVQSAYLPTYPN